MRQIANSIKEFGFWNLVLIDDSGQIVAGHGRAEAARMLGLNSVATVRLSGLTKNQIRAYALADNKLAEGAGGDTDIILAIARGYLTSIVDIGFDVTITGFEAPEVDPVHAGRTGVSRGLGHISMTFGAWTSFQTIRDLLRYAAVIFSIAVLPYLVWRLQRARSLFA